MTRTLLTTLTLLALAIGVARAEDAFEENDSYQTAATVGAGVYDGLEALDNDWFGLDAAAGGSLKVEIQFAAGSGDLDLVLVGPDLKVIARSQGTGDSEVVEATATVAGRHYWAVYGYQGATNAYRMIVSYQGQGDDAHENNDTRATAAALEPGNHDLHCADDDWFAVQVTAGQEVTADVLFSHAAGDLDVELYDAGGTKRASSASTSDQETVRWTATSAGAVYLRIYGYQGATGDYELRLRRSAVSAEDPTLAGSLKVGEVRGTIYDSSRAKNVEVVLHYPATQTGVGTPIDRGAGPFALVSHGHGRFGVKGQNPPNMLGWNYYYEHLGSHGFMIIAPNLDDNSVAPEPAGYHAEQILINSADMSYCITFMLNANANSSSSFSGTIRADKVAVSGHSRGGEAALHAGKVDSRTKVVVSIAPTDFHGLSFSGKRLLLWNATVDCDVPSHIQQGIYNRWPGMIRLITVQGGGHFLWTDTAGPICNVPLPRAVQHRLTKHYVLSFLDQYLRGDDRYAQAWSTQLPDARIQQK